MAVCEDRCAHHNKANSQAISVEATRALINKYFHDQLF